MIDQESVLPSYTVWGGKPAQMLGTLTESWPFMMQKLTQDFYLKFQPVKSSSQKKKLGTTTDGS